MPVADISTQCFFPICSTKSGNIFGVDGSVGLVKRNAKGELLEHRSCSDEGEGEGEKRLCVSTCIQSLYFPSLVTAGKQKMNDSNKQEELGCEILSKTFAIFWLLILMKLL